jgi:ketosteroid isomerase-like protein
MSAKENKAIFLRFLDELSKGNLGVVDEVCSPNFAFYSPNWPNWPRGLEGARKLVAPPAGGPVETRFKVEDIFAEDDKVAVRWTFRGTYQGEAKPGFPKPGEKYAVGAISIYRFVDGKIEEDWGAEAFSPTDAPWD